MKTNNFVQQAVSAAIMLVAASPLMALPFTGTEITIFDGDSATGYGGGYSQREDQEVEPGMVRNQVWDLEGFWAQDGDKLAMVGGFNFVNGVSGYRGVNGQKDFRSGDVFIDLQGDHIAGNAVDIGNSYAAQAVVNTTFGYEFALDINWNTLTYDLVALEGDVSTQIAWYDENFGSNPWKYVSGGRVLASGLSFNVQCGLSDADTGYLGGQHCAAYGFDVAFLGNDEAYFHFTMGCGNDNLMGHRAANVPEPASLALLALGVLGLGMLRVRNIKLDA